MSAAERFGCLCPLLDVLKHNSSKRAALYRRTILLVVIIILLGEKIQFAAAKQRQWYGVNTIRAAQEEGIQATTELDGKIYALVGYFINDLRVFDPSTLTWEDISGSVTGSPISEFGTLRRFGLTSTSGKLYFFGGVDNSNVDSNKLMSWDPETMTWHDSLEQSAVRPTPRQIPGFAGAGGMLYVFGGFSQGAGYLNDVCEFNTGSGEWRVLAVESGAPPSPAWDMGFAVGPGVGSGSAGPWLYALGGFSEDGVVNNALRAFEPAARVWHDLSGVDGHPPSARYGMGFAVAHGLLYVFGGASTGVVFNDLHIFDPSAPAWAEVHARGESPAARSGAGFHAVGSEVFLFAGRDFVGERPNRRPATLGFLDPGDPGSEGQTPERLESRDAGPRMVETVWGVRAGAVAWLGAVQAAGGLGAVWRWAALVGAR